MTKAVTEVEFHDNDWLVGDGLDDCSPPETPGWINPLTDDEARRRVFDPERLAAERERLRREQTKES